MKKFAEIACIALLCTFLTFGQGPLTYGSCIVYSSADNPSYPASVPWSSYSGYCLRAVLSTAYYALQYAAPTGFCQGRPIPGQPGQFAEFSLTEFSDMAWSCNNQWTGESYALVEGPPAVGVNGLIYSFSEVVGWLGDYYTAIENTCLNQVTVYGVPSGFTLLDC